VRSFLVNSGVEWVDTKGDAERAMPTPFATHTATGVAPSLGGAGGTGVGVGGGCVKQNLPTPAGFAGLLGGVLSAVCYHYAPPSSSSSSSSADEGGGNVSGCGGNGPSFLVVSASPSGLVRCQSVGHGELLADLRP
jgi:hypothetical protein